MRDNSLIRHNVFGGFSVKRKYQTASILTSAVLMAMLFIETAPCAYPQVQETLALHNKGSFLVAKTTTINNDGYLFNLGDQSHVIWAYKKIVQAPTTNWGLAFCLGICYSPHIDTTPSCYTIYCLADSLIADSAAKANGTFNTGDSLYFAMHFIISNKVGAEGCCFAKAVIVDSITNAVIMERVYGAYYDSTAIPATSFSVSYDGAPTELPVSNAGNGHVTDGVPVSITNTSAQAITATAKLVPALLPTGTYNWNAAFENGDTVLDLGSIAAGENRLVNVNFTTGDSGTIAAAALIVTASNGEKAGALAMAIANQPTVGIHYVYKTFGSSGISLSRNEKGLLIHAGVEALSSAEIFDLGGRLISAVHQNGSEIRIPASAISAQGAYILRATTASGRVSSIMVPR